MIVRDLSAYPEISETVEIGTKDSKRLIMAQILLDFKIMLVTAGLIVAGIGSLALILRELRKAPEGYEDEHCFRIVSKKAVRSGVPGSVTTKTRGTHTSRHRPMRHAPAH
jgi:hypothetical protein